LIDESDRIVSTCFVGLKYGFMEAQRRVEVTMTDLAFDSAVRGLCKFAILSTPNTYWWKYFANCKVGFSVVRANK